MTNIPQDILDSLLDGVSIDPNDVSDIKDFVDSFGDSDLSELFLKIIQKKRRQILISDYLI